MADKPIIFSAESVAAILRGDKTQTRRVVKPSPETRPFLDAVGNWIVTKRHNTGNAVIAKPQPYAVGDRLWVREAWAVCNWTWDEPKACIKYGDGKKQWHEYPEYRNIYSPDTWQDWLISVTDKLQDTYGEREEPDSKEGWVIDLPDKIPLRTPIHMPKWAARLWLEVTGVRVERLHDIMKSGDVQREGYKVLNTEYGFAAAWDELNEKRGYGWDENPWVWVYTVRR